MEVAGTSRRAIIEYFRTPGRVHSVGEMVLDPVSVPPPYGIDLEVVELHRETDVITGLSLTFYYYGTSCWVRY